MPAAWERGQRMMSLAQAYDCAVALGCSIDEIAGHEVAQSFSDPREAELHRCWQGCTEENRHALLVMADVATQLPEDSLLYLDPPYVEKGPGLYENSFDEGKHRELADDVRAYDGNWMVTYDDDELVRRLYSPTPDWRIDVEDIAIGYSAATRRRASEVLVLGPGMSQQKARCERNHVELRKLLPKGRGIPFDLLDDHDMACVMGELDSEPRPSLGGLTPVAMLRAAYGPLAEDLMDALGVEDVPYEELDLTLRAVEAERRERGEAPLL